MSYNAGTAFVQVMPSFEGVVSSISAEFTKDGEEAGKVFSRAFNEAVKSGTDSTSIGPSDSDSTRQGNSAAGKFADAFKARIEAALRALPDFKVGLDASEADIKLNGIRAELVELGNKTIGIDITDAEALAKAEELRLELLKLTKSKSIEIKTNALAAAAEIGTLKAATDAANGNSGGGLKGLFKTVYDGIPELGGMTFAVLALGPALIPIAAAALGAAVGLTGMAIAATAGIGAFGLAVIPVFTQVSTSLQQISADQTAVNRATSTAQKNTAITHLQDDLSNLSPFMRTLVTGILDVKNSFMNWDKQFDPLILKVFGSALNDVTPILNDLTPLVNAGGDALNGFFVQLGQVANSQGFKDFMDFLAKQAGPAISTITNAFFSFGGSFAKMLEQSGPLITIVENGITSILTGLANWVKDGGFQHFIDYVIQNGPAVVQFFKDAWGAIKTLVDDAKPIGDAIVPALGGLATAVQGVPTDVIYAIAAAIFAITIQQKPLLAIVAALLLLGMLSSIAGQNFKNTQAPAANELFNGYMGTATPANKQSPTEKSAVKDLHNKGYTNPQIKQQAKRFAPQQGASGITSQADSAPPPDASAAQQKKYNKANPPAPKSKSLPTWQAGAIHFDNAMIDVWHASETAGNKIADWFTKSLPNAFKHTVNAAKELPGDLGHVWGDVVSGLHMGWSFIANWVHQKVVQPVVDYFHAIPGDIHHVWGDVVSGLHMAWSGVANWVTSKVIDPVVNFFTGLPGKVQHVWSDVVSGLHKAWSAVANWVSANVIDPVVGFFENIPSDIHHVWSDVVSGLHEVWSGVANWVSSNVVDPVVGFFENMPTRIGNAIGDIGSVISSHFGNIVTDLAAPVNDFIGALNEIIDAYNNTIGRITGTHIGAIPTIRMGGYTGPGATGSAGIGSIVNGVKVHAAGGAIPANELSVVGEKGPELMFSGPGGHMLSNAALQSLLSGGSNKGGNSVGVHIDQATFKDEADLTVLQRKAQFAQAGARL